MAGGMGVGIGSFLNGLAGGYGVARQWDKEDADARLTERKLKLLEDRDARDAANDAQDRKWKSEDRARANSEYQANLPLENAKRAAGIQSFMDAQKERDMKAAAGEAATTAFKANPQKYSSVAEAYRDIAVPMVVEGYLKRGDTANADAFHKWANDKRIENGIETVGKLEQSFQRGDWDSVNKHYNALMSDGAYVPDTGFKYSAEPIKSKDGKTVGLRATTTSPDGESTNEDYTDIAQVHQKLMPMISPSTMFEFARHQYDQEQTAKAERAKGLNKLANDITLEGVKGGKITEAQAKAGIYAKENEAANALLGDRKVLEGGLGVGGAAGRAMSIFPGVGPSIAPESTKKFNQAAQNFVDNVVYSKSGANATVAEKAAAWNTYIPSPTDSADVIRQKSEARQRWLDQNQVTAGPALRQAQTPQPTTQSAPSATTTPKWRIVQ